MEEEYGLEVGQRVFPYIPRPDLTGQGSWQEFVLVPAQDVFPIPDCISDHVASQFYVNPWTGTKYVPFLHTKHSKSVIYSTNDRSRVTVTHQLSSIQVIDQVFSEST